VREGSEKRKCRGRGEEGKKDNMSFSHVTFLDYKLHIDCGESEVV
jgi:hypothetical protein